MTVHVPVLLGEVVSGLNLKSGSVAVDATLGAGGHSLAILAKIGPQGRLVAIDQDAEAIARFQKRAESFKAKPEEENFKLVHGNFAKLGEILFALGIKEADAILADLGISSDQLAIGSRGFSFQREGALDMRMDPSQGKTAREVVNAYSEEELARVLQKYGQERHASRIARAIIKARAQKSIETTTELAKIIETAVPPQYKRQKINCATKTFQALRLEVNQELENLEKFLTQAIQLLKSGGRLAVISFHSGEDSIVKNIFRENARGCICPPNFPVCRCGKVPLVKIINTRPLTASKEELERNPRARSAKLRIIEKI